MIERFDSRERFAIQLNDGISFFIGAGFSVLAEDKNNKCLPIGDKLLDELKTHFLTIKNFPDLTKASTILEATSREEFYDFLCDRFSVHSYSSLYDVLPLANITDIFTTNIDDLIYRIYESSNTKYINTTTNEGTPYGSRSVVNYSPVHGCVRFPSKGFIFSKTKLSSAYTNQRDDWTNLRNTIRSKPIIFWGWSFDDADVIQALYSGRNTINENDMKWILLRNPKDYEITFYETLGFKIIIGDTESLLCEVQSLISNVKSSDSNNISTFLPEYSVPTDKGTVLHPLISFFQGSAPQWSHIKSGEIQKTHYYNIVSDLIDKDKQIFVIGIPAAGKTTLMMQLMYSYRSNKPKYYMVAPSLAQVQLYIKKIGTTPVVTFVDDCFRDYMAVTELLKVPNVQFVGFDRDYAFENQIYRIRDITGKYEVVDITEITDLDSRIIIDSIPATAKKARTSIYVSDRTIYSTLSKNMKANVFIKRFRRMIKDFYRMNATATELFVLICYVHSCGVPVSYDMIFSYLSDVTSDYMTIYKLIKEVGNIIVKCGDASFSFLNVDFSEQDYYQSRSRYFAEQIMSNLPSDPNILRTVLMKVVDNVPAFHICRFDIFKRKGFDSDYAFDAFIDPAEGETYYEKCAAIDDSEYIYQQAALYFNKKRMYTKAFQWIERARNFASFNRFSITNTHAVISFNANIDKEDDCYGSVRNLLEESLNDLIDCYTNDRRKAIHVLSFSNAAIRFYQRFKTDDAIQYLYKAKGWLEIEKDTSDCGTRMKHNMENAYSKIQRLVASDY